MVIYQNKPLKRNAISLEVFDSDTFSWLAGSMNTKHIKNTIYVVYLVVILIWRFGDFSSICQRLYGFIAIICIAATAFRQIKVTPTAITDRFAKYSTLQ